MQEKVLINIYTAQCKHKCKIAQWELYGGAQLSAQSIAGMCIAATTTLTRLLDMFLNVFDVLEKAYWWCCIVYFRFGQKVIISSQVVTGHNRACISSHNKTSSSPSNHPRWSNGISPVMTPEFPLFFLHKMLLLLLCFHSQLINWPFKKNPHHLSNPYEILWKWLSNQVWIFY